MRRILICLITLNPLFTFAGGGVNVIEDIYQGIINLIIFGVLSIIFLPIIVGLIVSLFFPLERFKVFKQVSIGTFSALLALVMDFYLLVD